jgi:hypothetical protein
MIVFQFMYGMENVNWKYTKSGTEQLQMIVNQLIHHITDTPGSCLQVMS